MFFVQSAHSIAATYCSNVPYGLSDQFPCQHSDGFLSETPFRRLPRNRCNCGNVYILSEWVSIVFDRSSRSDLQSHEPQFVSCDGTKLSKASVFRSFSAQMTTFHLIPVRHLLALEAKSLLVLDYFRLFFSHFASVGRLTPKTRWTPRILERS